MNHLLKNKIQFLTKKIDAQFKKLQQLRQKRLFWGLSFFSLLFFSQILTGFYFEILAFIIPLPLFIYYIIGSGRALKYYDSLKRLHFFYQRQLSYIDSSFLSTTPAELMHNPDLARDLDLNVLFDQLNLCFSVEGELKLNQWLCQEFGDSKLLRRHENLKELLALSGPIRRLQSLNFDKKVNLTALNQELSRPFLDPDLKWSWIIPISWVLFLVLLFLPVPGLILKSVFFVFIATSLFYLNHTQYMLSRLETLSLELGEMSQKITLLEKVARQISFAPHLKKQTASLDLKKINRLISLIGVRTNPILFYILNTLFPWDFIFSRLCEKSRQNFYDDFKLWSKEAIDLDVYLSLINLNFYRQVNWPQKVDEPSISFNDLAHPLIPQNQIITNDFESKKNRVFIITGSNMSGKSTFLRAMGLNFCLAQIGAGVFAKDFLFSEMKIVTCIRVSDSLRDGKSYFFAEVQRMKKILSSAISEPVFFLIDEPLRGTNNQERLIGNQKYLQKLLQSQGFGFICTHDLELTKMTENNNSVINLHFSDLWQNNDLHFDYKIKPGPSTTTNALKILDKEGLL